MRSRERVRAFAARAALRAKEAPAVGTTKELTEDVENLAFAVEILCDVIANMEFHRSTP
jgi:hypothetical protein